MPDAVILYRVFQKRVGPVIEGYRARVRVLPDGRRAYRPGEGGTVFAEVVGDKETGEPEYGSWSLTRAGAKVREEHRLLSVIDAFKRTVEMKEERLKQTEQLEVKSDE